ncbi:MAG: hypothetical protein V1722_05555 [Candidatus Micrarchaeota archaeon]
MPENKYPLFEKTVPRYGWLHGGKGQFLAELYHRCERKYIKPEKIAAVTKQMMALGPEKRHDVAKAVRLAEDYFVKFRRFHENATYQGIDGTPMALEMLHDSTKNAQSLAAFLKKAEQFPHKLIFQPGVHHCLFGCAPHTTGHFNLSHTFGNERIFYVRDNGTAGAIDEVGLDANAIAGKDSEATVTFGEVKEMVKVLKPVRRVVVTGWIFKKKSVVEETQEVEIPKRVKNEKGENLFAIQLHFTDRRYDDRSMAHTAYTILLPEKEYHGLRAKVEKNPSVMAQLYNAVYPWHGQGKKFSKIKVDKVQLPL